MAKYIGDVREPIEAMKLEPTRESIREALLFTWPEDVVFFEEMLNEKIAKVFAFDYLHVKTFVGQGYANFGDYIIKGRHGEFYAVNSEYFEKTYKKEDRNEIFGEHISKSNSEELKIKAFVKVDRSKKSVKKALIFLDLDLGDVAIQLYSLAALKYDGFYIDASDATQKVNFGDYIVRFEDGSLQVLSTKSGEK